MSLTVTVDGVALNNRVRLRTDEDEGISGLTSAADGSGSSGGIVIDDPDHDLLLQGWQTVVVEESACSRPRLFTGFIGDRTTTHGKYPTAGGRQVNVTINDQNALLSFRLITGTDGKRPSESRTARLAWLLASDYLDGIVFDTGFIVPSGTSDFDEADYRGQYARDVLDDVLGAFQVAFAFWDDAASKVGLFYDTVTATTYDSTLSISNDPADTTSTCIQPYIDAELMQDPSGVYSLERLTYTNGILLRSDSTTAAQFFPSPYLTRGEATDRSRIGKATTASDYINALLAQGSTERETVTCTIRLPASQVGLIDAGMRASVKFTHLDGYEAFTYTRVTSRVIREVTGRRDLYEVQLVLNQRAPIGGGGGGGGSNPPPTTFPPGPDTGPTYAYDDCLTFPGYPTTAIDSLPTVVTFYNGDVYSCDYTAVQSADDGMSAFTMGWGETGGGVFAFGNHNFGHPAGTATATEGWTVAGLPPVVGSDFMFNSFVSIDVFKSGVGAQACAKLLLVTPGPDNPSPSGVAPTPQPLAPGQPNRRPESVTMSGANGTTLWPFADGTLRVFYDIVDQTAAIVSYDGAAGTFVMPSAPPLGTQVFVEYLGR